MADQLPPTPPTAGGASIQEVKAAMDKASAEGNQMMLWNIEFQANQRKFDAGMNIANKAGAQGQSFAR